MERLTDAELQAIKERAERATPGPWLAVPIVDSYEYVVVGDSKREAITGEVYERDDAIFIEYARSDVPKLLAEVERLKAALRLVLDRGLFYASTTTEHHAGVEGMYRAAEEALSNGEA